MILFALLSACLQAGPVISPPLPAAVSSNPRSYATGQYRNLFREIGKSDEAICDKLNQAYLQLFHGDPNNQTVYYPVGTDMAYIKDIGNNDVRTEGMSYGMMMAVQFGRKDEFDRLWRWAKTYMQHASGPYKGYFAWQCDDHGKQLSTGSAPDGEEYFVMALFFADGRWGSGVGIKNYRAEANAILHAMIRKEQDNGGVVDQARNMFDARREQVVFSPSGDAAKFTDPSYHLPAFYDLWAEWAAKDQDFWRDAAATSRAFFKRACDPKTGLAPDKSDFDGKPMKSPWDARSTSDDFEFDAFRVAGNIATDWAWVGKDPWQVEQSNRLLEFFARQKPSYVSTYALDGTPRGDFKSTGLIAMNASAALASNSPVAKSFVQELWDAPIPSGKWRYYDGMLYLFGLLQCSGQYRIWPPHHQ